MPESKSQKDVFAIGMQVLSLQNGIDNFQQIYNLDEQIFEEAQYENFRFHSKQLFLAADEKNWGDLILKSVLEEDLQQRMSANDYCHAIKQIELNKNSSISECQKGQKNSNSEK